MPVISVITPFHNRAGLVVRAVESVLGQGFADLEYILVDDASTDGGLETARAIDDPRVTVLSLPTNSGASAARNHGLARASGKYVAFLDSDDYRLPGSLAAQAAWLDQAPAGVGLVHGRALKGGLRTPPPPPGEARQEILVRNFIPFSTTMVRKSLLDQLREQDGHVFDPNLPGCNDLDLWIRLSRLCDFGFLDQDIAVIEQQPDSISSSSRKAVASHREIRRRYAADIRALPRAARGRFHFAMARLFWWKRALPDAARHMALALLLRPAQLAPALRKGLPAALRRVPPLGPKKRELKGSADKPVHVVQLIEHLRTGGAERVVVDLARGLGEGFRPTVLLYREEGELVRPLREAGVRAVLLRKELFPRPGRAPRVIDALFTGLESALFVPRLALWLRRERVDVLHSHMFSANLWGRLAAPLARLLGQDMAVIVTEHSARPKDRSAKRRRLNRMLRFFCDRVVAVTGEVRSSLLAQGVEDERITVVYNGVELPGPELPPLPPELGELSRLSELSKLGELAASSPSSDNSGGSANSSGSGGSASPGGSANSGGAGGVGGSSGSDGSGCSGGAGGGPIVMAVGRAVPAKRFDILLRALALLPDDLNVQAWIVGDGEELPGLRKLARNLGLARVHFLGRRDDARQLAAWADVVVNSSDREGLSIALLEAMAARRPIAATAAGGTPGLIHDEETGLLVPTGEPAALAAAVERLLRDPELARRLGERARALVEERFSLDAMVRAWTRVYLRALQARKLPLSPELLEKLNERPLPPQVNSQQPTEQARQTP